LDTDTSIDSLTDEATNFLYAERDPATGVITNDVTIIPPIYGSVAEQAPYGGANSTLDQAIGYNTNNLYTSQKITTGLFTGYLSRVTVYLKKAGTPTGGVLTMELQSDNAGSPSGTALETSTTTITETDLTTSYAATTFAFAGTYVLKAGVTYHFVVKFSGRELSTSHNSLIRFGASNVYSTVGFGYCNSELSWTISGSYSLDMFIYQIPKFFFSIPEMKMYEWASEAWTEKQIVFLGEAVCSGGEVTSVVNYALRGEFTKTYPCPTASTWLSMSHNIGSMPLYEGVIAICKIPELEYTLGQTAAGMGVNDSSNAQGGLSTKKTRNTALFGFGYYLMILRATTMSFANLTPADWDLQFTFKRGW